jgi:hypothetical protein
MATRCIKCASSPAFDLPSLLAGLRAVCATFPDPRKGCGGNIAMADLGLSAFALFFMQSASFLSFQRTLPKGRGRSNCQTLFGIVRDRENPLRQLHPRHARRGRSGAVAALLRARGAIARRIASARSLRQAGRQNPDRLGRNRVFLLAKARLPALLHAQGRQRQDRELSYDAGGDGGRPRPCKVVPLFPEFIAPQDGAEKQDCERNAVKRWHDQHDDRLRGLRPVYLGDDLFAANPSSKCWWPPADFIFTCKESPHKALYDFIAGAEPEPHQEKVRKGKTVETRRYRWIEGVPLRDSKDAALVNWIGFEIVDGKGRVKYSMAWVASLPRRGRIAAWAGRAGRSRTRPST